MNYWARFWKRGTYPEIEWTLIVWGFTATSLMEARQKIEESGYGKCHSLTEMGPEYESGPNVKIIDDTEPPDGFKKMPMPKSLF